MWRVPKKEKPMVLGTGERRVRCLWKAPKKATLMVLETGERMEKQRARVLEKVDRTATGTGLASELVLDYIVGQEGWGSHEYLPDLVCTQ